MLVSQKKLKSQVDILLYMYITNNIILILNSSKFKKNLYNVVNKKRKKNIQIIFEKIKNIANTWNTMKCICWSKFLMNQILVLLLDCLVFFLFIDATSMII